MNVTQYLAKETLAIFLFHGVVDTLSYSVRNYKRKHIEKDYFYQLLKQLKNHGTPLSMEEIIDYHQNQTKYPPQAFCITFDDGFENNYSVAAPVLKELEVPATFYITTGFIEHNWMSWIDRIEFCLESVTEGQLFLPWNPEVVAFRNTQDKIRILDNIRHHAKRLPDLDLEKFVQHIFEQCKIPEIDQSQDPLDLKMNWEQVKKLQQDELFIVGGHSHTHPILSFLSPSELEKEISTSVSLLKTHGAILAKHYSYPEGLAHCYSQTVIENLKAHGVICCPTAIDGLNRSSDSLFELKRIMVV